jgi:aryl-alcohol dehydrogenase-like predicted oxidoreductase
MQSDDRESALLRGATLTRREMLLMAGAGLILPGSGLAKDAGPLRRGIPGTGESLAVLGLGTWQAFDTPARGDEFDDAAATLRAFVEGGGRLIDTSPMYGRAEARVGEIVTAGKLRPDVFLATKIWTRGREEGERQLAQSLQRLGQPMIDLVQVHNLLDFDTHWRTLREARESGRVRFLGITHYQAAAHAELERVMRAARPDFLQVNYSLAEPEAGGRLLPAARDQGVAVLINRPFAQGGMLGRAARRALPPIATELGCLTAAQVFLKWVLSDPAVTVVLAGTRNPRHVRENLAAAVPPLPTAGQRSAIEAWFGSL